jgi:hypothetical protein
MAPLGGTREKSGAVLLTLLERANGLVKAYIEAVELRGLEPLTFSLRRLRLAGACARCGRLSVHCVHPDHGHDVAGAHMGHTAASKTIRSVTWPGRVRRRSDE